NVEILVVDSVRRAFQLHIAASAEVHVLTLGQTQGQLLDEGGHVGVGLDGALPLLDPEHLLRNLDLHVLLDRGLAGQAPAFPGLALVEVGLFGGQHAAATALNNAFALRTGAPAATGGGEKDTVVGKRTEQLATGGNGDGPLAIDFDVHVPAGYQTGTSQKNDHHQCQHETGEHSDG